MKIIVIVLSMMFTSFGLVTPAVAESAPVYTAWRNNIAAGGYDTVSFFSGKPQEGKAEFQTEYKGAVWHFSNETNLTLFKANPEAFAPQYGGYCAWAVANGKLAKGSPKYWHVRDGRLFLNFNARVQKNWNRDREGFIQKADKKWSTILLH